MRILISLIALVSAGLMASEPKNETVNAASKDVIAWPEKLPEFMEAGIKEARDHSKPILIGFGAKWCGPCKVMDRQVFPHPLVSKEMENWIQVNVDRDKYPHIARGFKVTGLPTYVLVTEDGRFMKRIFGLQMADEFAEMLEQARVAQ